MTRSDDLTMGYPSAGAAQPAASRVAAAAANDDVRMQDMILSEVLDSSTGVRWSDIAGLATAKQVIDLQQQRGARASMTIAMPADQSSQSGPLELSGCAYGEATVIVCPLRRLSTRW